MNQFIFMSIKLNNNELIWGLINGCAYKVS